MANPKVLIVEDESAVANLVEQIVKRTATDADTVKVSHYVSAEAYFVQDTALAIVDGDFPERPGGAITPGMGLKVIEALLAANPQTGIIALSGGNADYLAAVKKRWPNIPTFEKPVGFVQLKNAIRGFFPEQPSDPKPIADPQPKP